jgi:hypothetical protein
VKIVSVQPHFTSGWKVFLPVPPILCDQFGWCCMWDFQIMALSEAWMLWKWAEWKRATIHLRVSASKLSVPSMRFECNLAQQMTTTCLATVSSVTIFTLARKLVVISCWRFGATSRYYLQRSVRNHHYLLSNNPERRSSHLLGIQSLKSRTDVPAVHIYCRFPCNLVQQICTACLNEGCTFRSGSN